MSYQSIFKRYELKYLLTIEQKERVIEQITPYMHIDHYGRTTIRNIYFDTENYRLIRRSIEKPIYKEKLRIRSYQLPAPNSPVFVELKKKYDKVVYKRRISLPEKDAMGWLCGRNPCISESQIAHEIDYFLHYYENLHPVLFLSYAREAYYSVDGSDFRVTFDDQILCRQEDLSLHSDVYGISLLEEGKVLMEVKCSGGIPLWLAQFLSKERIYKTSFSKYGIAYEHLIFPQLQKPHLETQKERTFYA